MAQQTIGIGSAPNDTTGDPLRTAFGKCNGNFTELYQILQPPRGRLTLLSATPVMNTSQSAKTTLYYTPYSGGVIPIFNGNLWGYYAFSEISVATTDTSKNPSAIGATKVNDWFVWVDAGTLRLTHGPDWTNVNTRSGGTALILIGGIWVNNAAITNGPAQYCGTYVGTTLSSSDSKLYYTFGGSASGGAPASLYLWNMYNRVATVGISVDNGSSYTYASGTVRTSRNASTHIINWVLGLVEDGVSATYATRIDAAATGNVAAIGIGVNVTTGFTFPRTFIHGAFNGQACAVNNSIHYSNNWNLGYNYVAALESSDVGTNTFDTESNGALFAKVML